MTVAKKKAAKKVPAAKKVAKKKTAKKKAKKMAKCCLQVIAGSSTVGLEPRELAPITTRKGRRETSPGGPKCLWGKELVVSGSGRPTSVDTWVDIDLGSLPWVFGVSRPKPKIKDLTLHPSIQVGWR